MKRLNTKFGLSLVLLALLSCKEFNGLEYIYIYSKDKSQVVTIISDYNKNERIIANGKVNKIPKKDFYKLNISDITELGDEIGVCWNKNGHNWEMVNDKAKIVKIKLDTTKYIFREKWLEDERGIPTPKYYWEEDCFTVGVLDFSQIKPKENGFVERR